MVINCGGRVLDLSEPRIMGICNITNDSFFPGSRVNSEKSLIQKVGQLLEEGADIIDVGGMSSRPGAEEIPLRDEIDKVLWGIKAIKNNYPEAIISVDTYRSAVVESVAEAGANMINDISGGELDPQMIETVSKFDLPYVLMHMKGRPTTMQNDTSYEGDLILYLMNYFKRKIVNCENLGIKDIIIDPGFGFGKSLGSNYRILKDLECFSIFDYPIMVGLSRKSMIYNPLKVSSEEALNGTTALHMIALLNGAKLLRVHDVRPAKECITLFRTYRAE